MEKNLESSTSRVRRMVQHVTKARMMEVQDLRQWVLGDVVARVAVSWPFLNRSYVTGAYGKVDRWSKCAEVYPHVLKIGETYREMSEKNGDCIACLELAELACEAAQ